MLLLLRCKHCRQTQNYESRGEAIGKQKRCVYCGKSFVVNRESIDRMLRR